MLEEADRAQRAVRDHEKHGDDLRHEIDRTDEDHGEGEERRDQRGVPRLVRGTGAPGERAVDAGDWRDAVGAERLEGPRRDQDGPDG